MSPRRRSEALPRKPRNERVLVVSDQRSYKTPMAFRAALTDKLRNRAKDGPWTLAQLQRQIAYDRLLERLFLVDEGWIVKGATALLARQIGVRGSLDVDVYREGARVVAERDLRAAVARDLGDWFRFELGAGLDLDSGVKIPVAAYVGATVWMEFHVDLVGGDLRMTDQPEAVPPLARVVMPDVEQHGYVAYPLVDHVADKVAATFEVHGANRAPSTRYRDLVDLVAIISVASVDAVKQTEAIHSEGKRRGLALPEEFDVPDRRLWEPGYAAEAAGSLLQVAPTLAEALDLVGPFINPVLRRDAVGSWDPKNGAWVLDK